VLCQIVIDNCELSHRCTGVGNMGLCICIVIRTVALVLELRYCLLPSGNSPLLSFCSGPIAHSGSGNSSFKYWGGSIFIGCNGC
jgi:hypothetical protein